MKFVVDKEISCFNLLTAEIDGVYHELAERLGLSDSSMLILYTLYINNDTCPLSDIVKLSGTRKQTINSALRKLEKENYIVSEFCGARKKIIHLTETGKVLANKTVSHIVRIENEIFASYTQEERNQCIELTKRYLQALKEKIRDI